MRAIKKNEIRELLQEKHLLVCEKNQASRAKIKTKGQLVAIVYPGTRLDSIPSLYNAAVLLSEHGYLLDIFTFESPEFARPVFNDDRVNLRVSRSDTFFSNLVRRHHSLRIRLTKLGAVSTVARRSWGLIRKWTPVLQTLVQVWRLHRRNAYRCIIGVDPNGLVQGNYLARLTRAPLVYYSLELLPSAEMQNYRAKRFKNREILLSRKAEFVIIQDEERAGFLARDNQIPRERFALVPNSPLSRSGRHPSDYWHRRFGLSSEQRVVLHTGSIDMWTGIEEIVRSVSAWPENWVLVVHTRFSAETSAVIDRLRELAVSERVFFSVQPVATREYDALVDGADIGIAFYFCTSESKFTGQNHQFLGLSSGKIADYLRAGLPIVVNHAGSISDLLQSERCGIAVENGSNIGTAIGQIAGQYQEYSERACQVFDKYLDFRREFQEVIRRIDSLQEETRCQ